MLFFLFYNETVVAFKWEHFKIPPKKFFEIKMQILKNLPENLERLIIPARRHKNLFQKKLKCECVWGITKTHEKNFKRFFEILRDKRDSSYMKIFIALESWKKIKDAKNSFLYKNSSVYYLKWIRVVSIMTKEWCVNLPRFSLIYANLNSTQSSRNPRKNSLNAFIIANKSKWFSTILKLLAKHVCSYFITGL